jgi:dihydrofolate reductase
MGIIVVDLFITLDGVYQGPGGAEEDTSGGFELGGWQGAYFDDETGESIDAGIDRLQALLLGRKTYDIFAGYWPKAAANGDPLGKKFDAVTKYVASRDPGLKLAWQNSKHLGADPVAALRAIKREEGPDLVTQGSADFLQTLFASDLVDEMTLLSFPVLLGKGKKLFRDGIAPATFALIDSKASGKGVVINRYRRISGEVATG